MHRKFRRRPNCPLFPYYSLAHLGCEMYDARGRGLSVYSQAVSDARHGLTMR